MNSINSKAWQLRQTLIAQEICRRGDFDNDEINRQVRSMLKNEEDFNIPERSVKPLNAKETVADAVKRVLT